MEFASTLSIHDGQMDGCQVTLPTLAHDPQYCLLYCLWLFFFFLRHYSVYFRVVWCCWVCCLVTIPVLMSCKQYWAYCRAQLQTFSLQIGGVAMCFIPWVCADIFHYCHWGHISIAVLVYLCHASHVLGAGCRI